MIDAGDYPAATASISQSLAMFSDLGEWALEASAIHYLGLLQLLTGHYPAAATSLRLALQLNRELGCRFREAETLTFLGYLAAPAADTGQAHNHMPTPSTAAAPSRRKYQHGPRAHRPQQPDPVPAARPTATQTPPPRTARSLRLAKPMSDPNVSMDTGEV